MNVAIRSVGEHTPVACSFRRLAENLVDQICRLLNFIETVGAKVRAGRPNQHAGRVRSP